ncbi:MAG: hypothetical protein K2H19_07205 [Ruminococcus sp.]|nr:hypothetical protein [Ruminococcus sp.]
MSEIIKNLELIAPDEEIMEGTFISNFFHNEDVNELSVCIRNGEIIDYAEKCIEHFNSLSDDIIDEICHGLIESCHLSDEDFELPELENVRKILEYCWFTSMAVDVPEDNRISYVIEGEGDWGEVVGFVIKNGSLAYVGVDYEEYL